jgi:hypothetical protein
MEEEKGMKVDNSVEWQMRLARQAVPMRRWGKDHWSLFGFVETREVDHHGLINWKRVVVSARNWPMLYALSGFLPNGQDAADRYGLRLKGADGGVERVLDLCEVDALMDLVDEGLVTITMPQPDKDGDYFLKPNGRPLMGEEYVSPKFVTAMAEWELMKWASFRLTPKGREVADQLRGHKAAGGTWFSFEPNGMDL